MAPFFALKYAPPAMTKTTPKLAYPNAAPKDMKYGSIIVVSSVASTYGGKCPKLKSEKGQGRKEQGNWILGEWNGLADQTCRLLGAGFYYGFSCCFGGCEGWSCGVKGDGD